MDPKPLPTAPSAGHRAGFTLVEVVVAAVILALLAAVTVPQVMDALDKKRVQDSYDILTEIQYAIVNTAGTGFANVVRSNSATSISAFYPGRLTQLTEPILSGNVTLYPNSCGANGVTGTTGGFTGGNNNSGVSAQTTWTLGGPFLSRIVSPTDGLKLPIGQLQNTILRTITSTTSPPVGATGATVPQFIRLRVNSVDPQDQAALDLLVDGTTGATTGRVWYTAGGTTIDFAIAVALF
jgi:prepilin-type N-terminal cleavage/methylation domain-containing protein